jgi:hypothetical protein
VSLSITWRTHDVDMTHGSIPGTCMCCDGEETLLRARGREDGPCCIPSRPLATHGEFTASEKPGSQCQVKPASVSSISTLTVKIQSIRGLTPVILATQEAEIRRIVVCGQPEQIIREALFRENPSQKRGGGVARV